MNRTAYVSILAAVVVGLVPSSATAQQYYARQKMTIPKAQASAPADPVATTSSCGAFVTGRYISSALVALGNVTGASRTIRLEKAKALCEATVATACFYNDNSAFSYVVYSGTDTPTRQTVTADSNYITAVCKPN